MGNQLSGSGQSGWSFSDRCSSSFENAARRAAVSPWRPRRQNPPWDAERGRQGQPRGANPAPSGFVAARNPNSGTSSFPPATEIMGIPRPVHAVTSSDPTSLTSLATVRTDSARAGPISPMSLLTHGLLVTYSVAAATSPEQPVVRTSCMEPRQTSRSANHLPL